MIKGRHHAKRGKLNWTWEISDFDEERIHENLTELIIFVRSRTGLGLVQARNLLVNILRDMGRR